MRGCLLPTCLLICGFAWTQDWPQYRGPNGDGHSTAKGVPTEFSEEKNIRWKTAIHDKGWSSPVVWGEHVWLTTGTEDGKELSVLAVNRKTGKIDHDLKVFTPKNPPDLRKYNSHASPTPCLVDGKGYFHFGTYGTVCLDLKTAKPIWERTDINVDHWRGPASSPVIHGDLLYLTFDGHDKQYITAINKDTGKDVWTKPRNIKYSTNDGDYKKAFSTPQIITLGKQEQLLSSAADATLAYDPKTGDELWKVYHGGMNEACRPVFAHGLVYLTAGHTRTLLAVKPGTGDIAWQIKKDAPTRPSPIAVGDELYFTSDEGVAFCVDAKTGKQHWKERLGGPCTASPILVGGNLWFATENGLMELIEAKPTFNRVSTNKLTTGTKASPAAVDDAVYHRSHTHLYAIGKK
jgi:outer membrane protein assembly factor BamB